MRQETKLRPTILDVAERARVSVATVSNVLNGRRRFSTETARRVQDAVAHLGYRTDAIAANLRRAQAHVVGVIVPDFSNVFFGELISHLERLAELDGYHLAVMSSHEDSAQEAARIRALTDWRAAGLIIVPVVGSVAARPSIEDSGLAAVVVDRTDADTVFDSVAVDNAEIADTALRHLVAAGHSRILVAASSDAIPNMAARIDGALAAARELGVCETTEVLQHGASADEAHRKLVARLSDIDRPTAVLTLFNIATLETLRAAQRLGLTVPDDISVVGFDDDAWMEVANPPLTAVIQPVGEIAEAAWKRLFARLAGDEDKRETVRVTCRLIERGSVAPPKQRNSIRPTDGRDPRSLV